jgi:hypothetical protein
MQYMFTVYINFVGTDVHALAATAPATTCAGATTGVSGSISCGPLVVLG